MELNQQKSIVTAARQELYDRRDLMDVAFFNLQGRKSRKSMGPAGFACLNRLYIPLLGLGHHFPNMFPGSIRLHLDRSNFTLFMCPGANFHLSR
jgi:hypothetical protein